MVILPTLVPDWTSLLYITGLQKLLYIMICQQGIEWDDWADSLYPFSDRDIFFIFLFFRGCGWNIDIWGALLVGLGLQTWCCGGRSADSTSVWAHFFHSTSAASQSKRSFRVKPTACPSPPISPTSGDLGQQLSLQDSLNSTQCTPCSNR